MTKTAPIIYVVTNTVNGKQYVGQTRRGIKERWRKHVCRALTRKWECAAIAAAIRKYGEDTFTISETQLAVDSTQAEIDEAEKAKIRELKTLSPNGYNLTDGGKGGRPTEEMIRKMSEVRKGRPLSLEHRAKLSAAQKGRKRTSPAEQDGYRRQAEKLRGKPRPPEVIATMSKAQKERAKSPTSAMRMRNERMHEAVRGRVQPPDERARRSASRKAYCARHPMSDKTRKKLSEAFSGRIVSEETRAKMSAAQKEYRRKKQQEECSCRSLPI